MGATHPPETRRAALRLILVAGLLLLYPLGLMVLRSLPPAQGRASTFGKLAVTAAWRPQDGDAAGVETAVRVQNETDRPLRVDQVAVSVFVADRPAVTLIEADPALQRRAGRTREVGPKSTLDLGVFRTGVPRIAGPASVVATVECYDPAARLKRTLTAQTEIAAP